MGCVNGKASNDTKPSAAAAVKGSQQQKPQITIIEDKEEHAKEEVAVFQKKSSELGVFREKKATDSRSGDTRSLYSTFESELGLPRLSRLSSQYLPPSGFRLIQVPEFNYELRYSYLSQRGYYPEALDKTNQDSFCVHTQFGKNPNDHFFGVFDGHGEFGTQCSQFAKRHLCENMLRNGHYKTDAVQAYHASFAATNTQLHRSPCDDSMSGTTAITVLVRGKTLYIANVGDSRAVLAERRGGRLVAVDLSIDQTPYRADECDRVKQCGARVLTLDQLEGLKNPNLQCWGGEDDDDGDPPRLWVPNGMYPGTAFTRSIGDTVAERIGVMAVPEVQVLDLTDKHPFFVIASDGVFEFLSSQAVVDMVSKFKEPRDACAAIVTESYRLWLQYETRTDDITIIVVFVEGLEDAESNTASEEYLSLPSSILYEDMEENNSPLTSKRMLLETRPLRHDSSSARLRAIEASLEQEKLWAPPSELCTKTPEEKAHIKHALQGNFLFHKLMEKQWQVLYNCLKRVYVHAGEIVIRQGAEDDCFYIVESGEFEVLISEQQGGNPGDEDLGTVVHRHTPHSSTCFGDLALMYNKPRQASIRALTDGTLWTLDREAFRGLLLMKYTHRSALKHLRTVEMFSTLSLAHLVQLADSLTELQYRDGEVILREEDELDSLYVIHQGSVELTYHMHSKKSSPIVPHSGSSLTEEVCKDMGDTLYLSVKRPGENSEKEEKTETKGEGSYFGEWVLLNGEKQSMTAVAVGDVECWKISKDTFESALGPLRKILESDLRVREKMSSLRNKIIPEVTGTSYENIQLRDLEWQRTLYVTDCCEVGLVRLAVPVEQIVSVKRYSREKVTELNREAKVLLEKSIIEGLTPSIYVPQVLRTCIDSDYAAMLLNAYLAGTLGSILTAPLDEVSARYLTASIVLALETLHKDGVVYRGVSPNIVLLDRKARVQLVDFRFAKKLSDERTFTICGMADFLAPEVVRGQGHGLAADWWALGVLTFYMLHNEFPFGTWRENELDVFARIARRQLVFPSHFSPEVTDFIDKLLLVDPGKRLGCGGSGADSLKCHPWFEDLDWEGLLECHVDVPLEILSRLETALAFPYTKDYQHEPSTVDTNHMDDHIWLENW